MHSFVSLVQVFLQKHWLVKRLKIQIYLPSESLEKSRDCTPCSKKEMLFYFFVIINPLFHKLPMSLITKSSLQTWWTAKPLCYCWERRCLHQLCQHFVLWVPLYVAKKNTLQGKTHIYARQKSLYCATLKKGNSDIHENDLICIFHLSDLLLTMCGICSGILLFWGILVYYKVTYYLIITSCISTKMVTLWELSQQEVTPIRDF